MGAQLYTKKGDVQGFESIIIIIILVILVFLGIFFYFKFFTQDIQDESLELSEIKGSVLLDRVTSLPEFTCGINCVDAGKLISSASVISKYKPYYKQIFGSSFGIKKIEFIQLYPKPKNDKKCEKSDFTKDGYPLNCARYLVYGEELSDNFYETSNIVLMYYPLTDEYMLGKAVVGVSK